MIATETALDVDLDLECSAIFDLARDALTGAVAAEGWRSARSLVRIWGGDRPSRTALLIGACAAESDGFSVIEGNDEGDRFRRRGWLNDHGERRYRRLAQMTGRAYLAKPCAVSDPHDAWVVAAVRLRMSAYELKVDHLADLGRFEEALIVLVDQERCPEALALVRRALEILEGKAP